MVPYRYHVLYRTSLCSVARVGPAGLGSKTKLVQAPVQVVGRGDNLKGVCSVAAQNDIAYLWVFFSLSFVSLSLSLSAP